MMTVLGQMGGDRQVHTPKKSCEQVARLVPAKGFLLKHDTGIGRQTKVYCVGYTATKVLFNINFA